MSNGNPLDPQLGGIQTQSTVQDPVVDNSRQFEEQANRIRTNTFVQGALGVAQLGLQAYDKAQKAKDNKVLQDFQLQLLNSQDSGEISGTAVQDINKAVDGVQKLSRAMGKSMSHEEGRARIDTLTKTFANTHPKLAQQFVAVKKSFLSSSGIGGSGGGMSAEQKANEAYLTKVHNYANTMKVSPVVADQRLTQMARLQEESARAQLLATTQDDKGEGLVTSAALSVDSAMINLTDNLISATAGGVALSEEQKKAFLNTSTASINKLRSDFLKKSAELGGVTVARRNQVNEMFKDMQENITEIIGNNDLHKILKNQVEILGANAEKVVYEYMPEAKVLTTAFGPDKGGEIFSQGLQGNTKFTDAIKADPRYKGFFSLMEDDKLNTSLFNGSGLKVILGGGSDRTSQDVVPQRVPLSDIESLSAAGQLTAPYAPKMLTESIKDNPTADARIPEVFQHRPESIVSLANKHWSPVVEQNKDLMIPRIKTYVDAAVRGTKAEIVANSTDAIPNVQVSFRPDDTRDRTVEDPLAVVPVVEQGGGTTHRTQQNVEALWKVAKKYPEVWKETHNTPQNWIKDKFDPTRAKTRQGREEKLPEEVFSLIEEGDALSRKNIDKLVDVVDELRKDPTTTGRNKRDAVTSWIGSLLEDEEELLEQTGETFIGKSTVRKGSIIMQRRHTLRKLLERMDTLEVDDNE